MPFSEGARRLANRPHKFSREMALVGKTSGGSNRGNRGVGRSKHLGSRDDPDSSDVLAGRNAKYGMKPSLELANA